MTPGDGARIYVSGHRGLVGSAIVRALRARGHDDLLLRSRTELDLREQPAVDRFFAEQRPEVVVLAAAKVGGIHANATWPADFLYDNLMIEANVVHAAFRHGARKLLFLGSSCIYPKFAPQPIAEDALLGGPLEPTNEAYAIAKIAGLKLCQAYRAQHGFDAIVAMPTNLYGPGDNYHPENSHVVPGLIRRFHEAKKGGVPEVVVWGTGTPRRELLHVDDLADAALHLLSHYSAAEMVNIGSGQELTIAELAREIASAVGYDGRIVFDSGHPDGTPRKRLDTARLDALGWRARIPLHKGLAQAYADFLDRFA